MSLAANLVIQGGADNDGQGDSGRVPFAKYNQAITELYGGAANGAPAAAALTNLGATQAWYKVGNAIAFRAFAAVALSFSIPLFSLPAAGVIHGIKIKHSAAFSGGAIGAYTVSVGDVGSAALYASAFDVFQPPGSRVYQLSSNFGAEDHASATQIYATAVAVGDNLSAAAVGSVDIWALLSVAA